MSEPTLNDLTKEELIGLLRERYVIVRPDQIAFIIWQRETTRALQAMNAAQEKIKATTGSLDEGRIAAWRKANDEWDKAARMLAEANKKYDQWRNYNEGE